MSVSIRVTAKDATGWSKAFESLDELADFIKSELEFWLEKNTSLRAAQVDVHPFLNVINLLKPLERQLSVLASDVSTLTNQTAANNAAGLQKSLNQLESTWIWSGQPLTHQFLRCHEQFGKVAANHFFAFVKNYENGNPNTLQEVGRIAGYEYIAQGEKATDRSQSEKSAFEEIRGNLEKQSRKLILKFKETNANVEDLQSKAEAEFDSINRRFVKYAGWRLKKTRDKVQKALLEIAGQREESKNRQRELEDTYKNKLRLSKPAEYWKLAASQHKKQAEKWSYYLAFSVVFGLVTMAAFFVSWLGGVEVGLKLNTLQGAVLFAAILAIYAFFIKTLAKLTFSSYHLMRDCEEREQLTHLYLALVKDGGLEDDSLKIVLQSLFSRSDSGLLSAESGPTMPGGFGELIKLSGK